MFSKKHYEAIAQTIRDEIQPVAVSNAVLVPVVIHKLADLFQHDNPNFKRDRFVHACQPSLGRCECSDPRCPVHNGRSECRRAATTTLYRSDTNDYSGVRYCDPCADDALESGLFSTDIPG